MQQRKRIGERLIDAGLITQDQLELALKEQKTTGELLGAILYAHGFISQKDLFTMLSMSYSGEYAKDKEVDIDMPQDIRGYCKTEHCCPENNGEGARQNFRTLDGACCPAC